jgi:6-phosphogluconolactonase (cycloisomerase 2 family)
MIRPFALAPMLVLSACSGPAPDETGQTSEAITSARRSDGAVFTMSNDASGNSVLAFRRAPDGRLSEAASYATGGRGSGDGLGSQGAIALSDDGRFLLVVDPGSDDVASFEVEAGVSLHLRSRVPSGGARPVSVATRGELVYVLNAGGNNVSGFRLRRSGELSAIAGSTRSLGSAASGPAQIAFDPRGQALVVTEKAANAIDVFAVQRVGVIGLPTSTASSGQTPFGFAFTRTGQLIVSEAFGGAAGKGAVSSYSLARDPRGEDGADEELHAISASVPDLQAAPCWVVIAQEQRLAYVSNTASGTISGYRVARDGLLHLLAAVSADTGAGSKPTDMAFDAQTRHLYVLDSGTHDVEQLDVADDGSLATKGAVAKIPATAVGLVAR